MKGVLRMSFKYETLIRILDFISSEAPSSYKLYHPDKNNADGITKSRSLAFIHLLLKVRFGIEEFSERHKLITDGTQDGGLDAFYIDSQNKKTYLIQSKFFQTERNFTSKSMTAEDLIKMDVKKIIKGSSVDSIGNQFNEKVINFQRKIGEVRDISKYDFIVVFLGNIYKYSDNQIRKAIENNEYEIINAEKAFDELIFPLATGTYYDPEEITIEIDLHKKDSPKLTQEIVTDFGKYKVMVIFVPTIEVGRILLKYKNAILKYNPRNFLSLKKGGVNQSIKESVLNCSKNNFALLNNGITILSEKYTFSETTGRENEGQLILVKPQIINGGQTAFTLSEVYKENVIRRDNPLIGKEVLLKIITPSTERDHIVEEFIEQISNATNQQNEVIEADRRSNHAIQIGLQKKFFDEYGYFYERKTGEFYEGISQGFIEKEQVINRFVFIKAYQAYLGEPAAARRISETVIFKEDKFYSILQDIDRYHDMFFSYLLFDKLEKIEKEFVEKEKSIDKYGYSLLYGKWAVVASIGITNVNIEVSRERIFNQVDNLIGQRLLIWKEFDKFAKEKNIDTRYFNKDITNYELYYKVKILDEDIKEFFLR